MATACWRQVSWKGGLVQAPRGKWLTAAVDWPGGEPGRPGADGAAKRKGRIKKTTSLMKSSYGSHTELSPTQKTGSTWAQDDGQGQPQKNAQGGKSRVGGVCVGGMPPVQRPPFWVQARFSACQL